MRVAVSADDRAGLDGAVSPHFGRCPCFVLVDLAGRGVRAIEVVDNPFYGRHEPGQVPQFIKSQDADVMLTGGMGRRAITFFEHYGIEAVTGASGSVRHSLERYLGGALRGAEPCRESLSHGQDDGAPASGVERHDGSYEKDGLGRLREEVEMLQQQLDEVTARIRDLGEGP